MSFASVNTNANVRSELSIMSVQITKLQLHFSGSPSPHLVIVRADSDYQTPKFFEDEDADSQTYLGDVEVNQVDLYSNSKIILLYPRTAR